MYSPLSRDCSSDRPTASNCPFRLLASRSCSPLIACRVPSGRSHPVTHHSPAIPYHTYDLLQAAATPRDPSTQRWRPSQHVWLHCSGQAIPDRPVPPLKAPKPEAPRRPPAILTMGPDPMDEDTSNNSTTATSQASSHSTPQGALASQAGGASGPHSQGHPTPGSTRSSNTPSATSAMGSILGISGVSGMNSTNFQNSKRRRGLGVVTPNACTECRKKRAKV